MLYKKENGQMKEASHKNNMNLKKLYEGIKLQPQMAKQVDAFLTQCDLDALEPVVQQICNIRTNVAGNQKLQEMFEESAPGNIPLLAVHLLCAVHIYEVYQEKGISDQIYYDTMGAFTRFCQECYDINGCWYYDRAFWTYRQVSMQLFRIGILEYEFIELDGESMITVHIPSDVVFSEENLQHTFRTAKEFFAVFYPECSGQSICCRSWLMAPKLRELLPDTSGIIRFQNCFTNIKETPQKDACLYWLFHAGTDTKICDYPEDTSLQRKVKAMMLNGDHLGAGFGVLKSQL